MIEELAKNGVVEEVSFIHDLANEVVDGYKIINCSFNQIALYRVDFDETEIQECTFDNCVFTNCYFSKVFLTRNNFENCQFISCSFVDCNWFGNSTNDIEFIATYTCLNTVDSDSIEFLEKGSKTIKVKS